jgi:hypothetical protein
MPINILDRLASPDPRHDIGGSILDDPEFIANFQPQRYSQRTKFFVAISAKQSDSDVQWPSQRAGRGPVQTKYALEILPNAICRPGIGETRQTGSKQGA